MCRARRPSVTFSPDFNLILTGRFFVGIAYGMDFAVAMALLAEFTPARFKAGSTPGKGSGMSPSA
jgi:MFS family permease